MENVSDAKVEVATDSWSREHVLIIVVVLDPLGNQTQYPVNSSFIEATSGPVKHES